MITRGFAIYTLTAGQSKLFTQWSNLSFLITSSGSYTIDGGTSATFTENLTLGQSSVSTYQDTLVTCVSGTLTILLNADTPSSSGVGGGGGGAVWGSITGTITNQTDLVNYVQSKIINWTQTNGTYLTAFQTDGVQSYLSSQDTITGGYTRINQNPNATIIKSLLNNTYTESTFSLNPVNLNITQGNYLPAGNINDTAFQVTSTYQNSALFSNSIKIGNSTLTASQIGTGGIRYSSGLQVSDGTTWNSVATTTDLTAYAKLDGSNQPFTGNITIQKNSDFVTPQFKIDGVNPLLELNYSGIGTYNTGIKMNVNGGITSITNYNANVLQSKISHNTSFLGSNSLILETYGSKNVLMGLFDVAGSLGHWVGVSSSSITNNASSVLFRDGNANNKTTFTSSTGNWNFTGTAQNLLTIANGIRIGNNTNSASFSGPGSMRYNAGLEVSDGTSWNTLPFTNMVAGSPNVPYWDGTKFTNSGLTYDTANGFMDFSKAISIRSAASINIFHSNTQLGVNSGEFNIITDTSAIRLGKSGGNYVFTPVILGNNANVSGYQLQVTGKSLFSENIKIGNTTDTASVAGAGTIKYDTTPKFSNATAWNNFGAIEDNITTVATATYTALVTDYIINVTSTCTLTLPTIATTGVGVGRVYRIFSKNVPVSIVAGGTDTIDGVASFGTVGYSCVTLRALVSGEWRIGD